MPSRRQPVFGHTRRRACLPTRVGRQADSRREEGLRVTLDRDQATLDLAEKAYGLNQPRDDLRNLNGHGRIERDGSRYAYRLTQEGVQVALPFLFFHKRR